MRAVVIAIKEDKAAVAGSGGHFAYIDNNGYSVGQILELPEEVFNNAKTTTHNTSNLNVLSTENEDNPGSDPGKGSRKIYKLLRSRKFIPLVAAASLMLVFAGVAYANTSTAYTVSFSGDASVELSMNAFDRVVGIKTGDDEVSDVYSGLMFSKLPEAYETLLETVEDLNDGTEEPAYVSAAVKANNFLGEGKLTRVIDELNLATDNWNKEQKRSHVTLDFREKGESLPTQKPDEGGKRPSPETVEGNDRERTPEKDPAGGRQEISDHENINPKNPDESHPGINDGNPQKPEQLSPPDKDSSQEDSHRSDAPDSTSEDRMPPPPKSEGNGEPGNHSVSGTGDNNDVLPPPPPPKPDHEISQESTYIPSESSYKDNTYGPTVGTETDINGNPGSDMNSDKEANPGGNTDSGNNPDNGHDNSHDGSSQDHDDHGNHDDHDDNHNDDRGEPDHRD